MGGKVPPMLSMNKPKALPPRGVSQSEPQSPVGAEVQRHQVHPMHRASLGKGGYLEDAPHARKVVLVEEHDHPFGAVEKRAERVDTCGFVLCVELVDARNVEEGLLAATKYEMSEEEHDDKRQVAKDLGDVYGADLSIVEHERLHWLNELGWERLEEEDAEFKACKACNEARHACRIQVKVAQQR
eukprot:scaffold24018_cov69-Phaeocystis_antarctica.AAC.3